MLPAHLRTTTTRSSYRDFDETNAGGSRLRQPPPPPPSLCVTGAMCQQGNCRIERQPTTSDKYDKADSKNKTDKTLNETVTIAYRIFRPRQLLRTPSPLVVLHGGPSIPSTYLLPLVNTICDRAIVLHDQWGCGKSSRPTPTITKSENSPPSHAFPPLDIQILVDDLHYLITKEWKLQSFHLYGHSFGGILAYEYLKKYKPSHCQSLILASTPTSTALVESEMIRLKQELLSSQPSSSTTTRNDDNHNDVEEDEDGDDDDDDEYRHHLTKINHHPSSLLSSLSDPMGGGSAGPGSSGRPNSGRLSHRQNRHETLFFETHHCRVSNPVPLVLQDALASAGPIPWRGMAAIPNYQATTTVAKDMDISTNDTNSSGIGFPPTLLLKGEFDFVTRPCMEHWYNLLQPQRDENSTNPTAVVQDLVTVPNCSHYGMLEDEQAYGKILGSFFLKHDS
jgi:pimeloyl-ACP methyl ester carboxylesterase